MMRNSMRLLSCLVLGATMLVAQARDEREATVGMRAYVEGVVIEGSDPCSFRVRTMTNRALDYLIILDEKDLEGEIPRA